MEFGAVRTAHPTLIVAEVGNNHEGSFTAAQELVGRAAEAGVDVVKFQTFIADKFVSPLDPARLARLKKFQLSFEQFRQLGEQAHQSGLRFMSTPLDVESADFLAGVVDVMKVASGDNDCFPLLERAAASRKPLIVSTGFATMTEIRFATSFVRREWARREHAGTLGLLHCVSSYPVEPAEANLGAIHELREAFAREDVTIGYSDHTLGIRACVLAVASGARIIEKHFTLDRNYSDFRDHQLSADPTLMRQLVQEIRETELMLGTGEKTPQASEVATRDAVRRSLAASRDLAAGEIVTADAIVCLRPGTGIRPGDAEKILGRRLNRAVPAGTPFTEDVVR